MNCHVRMIHACTPHVLAVTTLNECMQISPRQEQVARRGSTVPGHLQRLPSAQRPREAQDLRPVWRGRRPRGRAGRSAARLRRRARAGLWAAGGPRRARRLLFHERRRPLPPILRRCRRQFVTAAVDTYHCVIFFIDPFGAGHDDDEGGLPAGLGGMFGGVGGQRFGRQRQQQQQQQQHPPKSAALHMKVPCTLEELYHGYVPSTDQHRLPTDLPQLFQEAQGHAQGSRPIDGRDAAGVQLACH